MKRQESVYNESIPNKQMLEETAMIFKLLFKDSPKLVFNQQQIRSVRKVHERQRVIHMDCVRTRSLILSEQLKQQLELLLTHYCNVTEINYKQGLNQIAGPFIYFRTVGLSLVQCQNLFHTFFSRYCLNFYQDQDFSSLEVFFKMLSIVLKYQNPSVSRYLQFYDIEPQIFCIGWLMTLFARYVSIYLNKLSLKMTYQLWQFYIMENDKFFLFFMVVGIVIYHKNSIMQAKNHSVFQTITDMIFKTQEQMRKIIMLSLIIRKNTPSSLLIFFRDRQIFQNRTKYNDVKILLQHIQKLNLFLVMGSEISLQKHFSLGLCDQNCYFCDLKKPINPCHKVNDNFLIQLTELSSDIRTMHHQINFVLVDFRRNKTQAILHSGQVFSVDLQKDILDIEQKFLQKYIEHKSISHFMFLLTQFTFEDMDLVDKNEFAKCLQFTKVVSSFGFPFLGILQGGYAAYQNLAIEHQSKVRLSRIRLSSKKRIQKQSGKKEDDQNEQSVKIQQFKINEGQEKTSVMVPVQVVPMMQTLIVSKPERISISMLFLMSNMVHKKVLRAFTGSKQILLLTGYTVILLAKNKRLEKIANHLQHSTSIIDFLFDNPDTFIQLESFRYYLVSDLTKTKVKLHNQNVLVLCLQLCQTHRSRALKQTGLKDAIDMDAQTATVKFNNCKQCPKSQSKILFQMAGYNQVEECAQAIKRRYKNLIKILKGDVKIQAKF